MNSPSFLDKSPRSSHKPVAQDNLSRKLDQEEVEQLRDLRHHQGWQLYQQGLGELLQQALSSLQYEKDPTEFHTLQGRISGLKSALGLPGTLLGTDSRAQETVG